MNDLVAQDERSVQDVTNQVAKIQDLMKHVMHRDEHYGVIPGTGKKPSLLKAGAEKLCFVFRLTPEFTIDKDDLPDGHREYRIKCSLRSMGSGVIVGEGVGSCSTMESKYRYRNTSDYEITDLPIPRDAKEKKAEYRKQGFGMKQIDGAWCWVKYKSEGKAENPDIADTYNTVLKMAKKRAHVDATITACAASDIFTQDVEDFQQEDQRREPAAKVEPSAQKKAGATESLDYEATIIEAVKSGKLTDAAASTWKARLSNPASRKGAEEWIRTNLEPVGASAGTDELDTAAEEAFAATSSDEGSIF